MKIYYDRTSEAWSHNQAGVTLIAGAAKEVIPFHEGTEGTLSFPVTPFKENRLLTVGILSTAKEKTEPGIGGNLELFRDLSHYLFDHGILAYVCTADSFHSWPGASIKGFLYLTKTDTWTEAKLPFPDIVYNRIPSRPFESTSEFKQLIQLLKDSGAIVFNPGFLDKFSMYEALREDGTLTGHLPSTQILSSQKELREFFEKHQYIYLKPRNGSQGKGIFTLKENPDGTVQFDSFDHKEIFPDFSSFWILKAALLTKKCYLMQKAIQPKKLNGHRYDYRILVHYENGFFKITGKAIRMSQTQEITTHTLRGGKLYPYKLLKTAKLERKLASLAQKCGETLSRKFGFLGEFSMDIGEDTSGDLYIYEVNAKPMQFDEKEIEASRLEYLKNLFIELTFPEWKRI